MSEDLDVAKREVEIYRKELAEEWTRYYNAETEYRKGLTGTTTEKLAHFIVNSSKPRELQDRTFEMMLKLLTAYENYVKLLERKIGK